MNRWNGATNSPEETIKLGRRIGQQLRGGEIIRLIGDVGAGKTTFVRGLAQGIDSSDHVSSPTFTVHKLYKGRIRLYHYDFYRVGHDAAIANELEEIMESDKTSVVLEWPEFSEVKLPAQPLDITFKATNEQLRTVDISIPNIASYIVLS